MASLIGRTEMTRRTKSRRHRRAAASFSVVTLTVLLLLLVLLLPPSSYSPCIAGVFVEAGPTDSGDYDRDDPSSPPLTLATTTSDGGNGGGNRTNNNRVFANVNENYISSSKSVDALTSMIEDDYRKTQLRMRVYWRRIFKEIRMSNPAVFPPTDHEEEEEEEVDDDDVVGAIVVDGSESSDDDVDDENDDKVISGGGGEGGAKGRRKRAMMTKASLFLPPTTPTRFDGFQTWENKLQQWREDVSTYLEESENRWNELLQPRDKSSGTYDMGSFGVSSIGLKRLAREEGREDADDDDDGRGVVLDGGERGGDRTIVGEDDADGGELRRPVASSQRRRRRSKREQTSSSWPSLSQRFGIDASSVAIPTDITLPITIANLDPNLPPIPKPRPVTSTDVVLPHTDISDMTKNIWIVTTGALPWMTGTAVNPLLRAAYLSNGRKEAGGSVTLMLPWVEREADQIRVYGKDKMFDNPDEQETYIRKWLRDTAGMADASIELRIRWYTAWQEVLENSLYSMGDIIGLIPEEECDICVLEEPEHLNWYRAPGENWTSKFKHVVGIVHTNYFVYATEQPAAFIRAPGMKLLTSWMCRAHCHRVIKLSGTLQQFAPEKELVENVHGVRRTFLDIGDELRTKLISPKGADGITVFSPDATPAVYFIGKMLWSKGLGSLMELMKYAEESAGLRIKMDMYGGGPDKEEASAKAERMGLDMPFHGPIDHAELGWTHKVFINPSLSEVLCTTVAEALAMGKFVVLPSHPSNDFFIQFPNCLPYTNKEEFVGNLYYALTHSPEPLTEEHSRALSWEAATERFAAAGSISVAEAEAMEEALSSTEAGIDIDLPPLTANEEQRKKISRTFTRTRARYRNFRSRLSQDITKAKVLPKDLQLKLIAELDKRLDVDLDEFLNSPKLRVKLSPAKLDKLLLELYDSVTKGPGGDVLRVIGGGANVGRQALYIKQQQSKLAQGRKQQHEDFTSFPDGPTSLVKRALKRNLPQKLTKHESSSYPSERNERELPKMSLAVKSMRNDLPWGVRLVRQGSFTQSLPPRHTYIPLI